jgi:hypothetical protein
VNDHILLRLICSLPGNPFVLVLNIQVPGDPPVSFFVLGLVRTDLLCAAPSGEYCKLLRHPARSARKVDFARGC